MAQHCVAGGVAVLVVHGLEAIEIDVDAVSYTHLTLPTIYPV